MEKTLDALVKTIASHKRRVLCALESGGCGSRHLLIDDDFLGEHVGGYVGYLYDMAAESHARKPRHISKNHIVSKSVFGKGHYKVTDEQFLNPVIVSSASRHFTVDAKFGDVFEIMCGYIESMWGNRKNRFFNLDTHEINPQMFRYMSKEYLELKTLTSLVFAIHKVRSDYKDMYMTRELTVESMVEEFLYSFTSVSWFITTHPTRERIMNIPLIPRDITKFAYAKEELEGELAGELDEDAETFLIPIDHYGYLETVNDGFGFLGAIFLFRNAFSYNDKSRYRETLVKNSEMWKGKECPLSGEIRVFYLNEDLTYKTAVTDCIHGRKGWNVKDRKVDAKKLSKVLNEYERLYITAGHGAAKKSFSSKNTTHGKKAEKKRNSKRSRRGNRR